MKFPQNIPASVRQRLLNRAKYDKRPFNELLQYYAMERFLFRLSQSAHADRFILKGALIMKLAEAIRLTFQRRGTSLPSRIEAIEQSFIDAKQIQWSAFRKRLQQDHVPESFKDVVSVVEDFLAPFTSLLSQDNPKHLNWPASGPWS